MGGGYMKKSFVLYTDQRNAIADLSQQQKGELLDALYTYADSKEILSFTAPEVKIAFNFISQQIDRDSEKYAEISKKRAEAGRRGGRPKKQVETKKANAFKESNGKQTNPDTDNDTVTDTDNDTDNNTAESCDVNGNKPNALLPEREKEKKGSVNDQREKIYIKCLEYYNNMIAYYGSSMKKVKALTDLRRERLAELFRLYNTGNYQTAICNAVQSKFCNGQTRERKKPVDYDWLIKVDNFTKAFEGSL